MIPVTQTKVVIKNKEGKEIVHGNCYAAAIASILELPITEVPNVEVFFDIPDSSYWQEVMLAFLESKGYELCTDDRYKVFHGGPQIEEHIQHCWNMYYLVQGKSPRGFSHICVYLNGKLAHDPFPTREGLVTEEYFQSLEKVRE